MSSDTAPDRRRLRAEGYDYAQPGWYFVTICTQDRHCLFGAVSGGVTDLSLAGQMVYVELQHVPERFTSIGLDAFVVMPNHVHAIIILRPDEDEHSPVSLSDVVGAYKRITTNTYIRKVREEGWPPFRGRLWQRSFHDQIISSDRHVDRLRDYIEANPFLWTNDTYYSALN
jgi:putative transposase